MSSGSESFFRRLGVRVLIAGPFFVASGVLMVLGASGRGGMMGVYVLFCLGVAALIVGAIIVIPVITGAIGSSVASSLFLPEREIEPAPRYSMAQAMIQRGEFEGALARFREIADEFPQEVRTYVEMIDVALSRLKDAKRAEGFYRQGLAALVSPEDRGKLTHSYEILRTDAARRVGVL